MKYMGSKNRHAKELLPIILKNRKDGQFFVDLFCGGANLVDKVSGNRIANDIHYYLISLLKALQNGYIPPKEISLEFYNEVKLNKDKYPPELVGFIGFPCSYAAKWFGGYCRGFNNKGEPRNYIMEAWNNCMNQAPNLKGIEFYNKNYWELEIPKDSIIYCDIPYKDTTKYNNTFDYEKFYSWVRQTKEIGHTIFISEYNMPPDFKCIWEKKVFNSLTKETGAKSGIEKLFVL